MGKKKRNFRSEAEIQAILEEQRRSGQSAKEYCQRHGIHVGNLYRWRREHKQLPTVPKFVEVLPAANTRERIIKLQIGELRMEISHAV